MSETTLKDCCENASRVLREAREKLASRFLNENPVEFLEQNAALIDDYFRESFEKSQVGPLMGIEKNPYAIIALGGYGRQEQCVHSDVDILFLFKKELPEKAESLIREIIFPLWDIGMDIGHATRSLKDCIRLAASDFEVLTSLLDARFICGMSPLYSELMDQIREKVVFRRSAKIIDWMIQGNQERHKYFGDSAYLLEPNLKEGHGGLRDYHTILWLARIKFNLKHPRDLEYHGFLSHEEFEELRQAVEFIWRVRNGLHIVSGRKYDRLHFEHQIRLADLFDYNDREGRPVERFLGDLHRRMETVKQIHRVFVHEAGSVKTWFNLSLKSPKATRIKGLEVRKEALAFESGLEPLNDPSLLFRIFEESMRLNLRLNPEARRLVRDMRHLADDRLRSSEPVRTCLERILCGVPDPVNALSEMHQTGLLTALIPEMAGVENRIEYDAYHLYPVDKHLIRTVQIIKSFGGADDLAGDGLCGDLMAEISEKPVLMWAALLHDIGKGASDNDHSRAGADMVREIMGRLGYGETVQDTLAFLVREHLLLIHTASRRDLEDDETIRFCAGKVGDPAALKMLYLLSVADMIATGPAAWTGWTAALLRELFLRTLKALTCGDPEAENSLALTKSKTAAILDKGVEGCATTEIETLLSMMTPRYFLNTSESDIREHLRLYAGLGDKPFVWQITQIPGASIRLVTVCGKNLPGFLSKMAGVFAMNRINILEAQIHTWRNNTALNVLKVAPPPDLIFEEERWERAKQELDAALLGKLNISKAMTERISGDRTKRPAGREISVKVNVDNTTSSFFTLIEVFSADAPGLLFRLTDALFRCRLDIYSAQISTVGEQAVDVFYVRDFDGRKVDSPQAAALIQAAVESALPETNAETPSKQLDIPGFKSLGGIR
jgi:[protein-PII] uridylyltransferase